MHIQIKFKGFLWSHDFNTLNPSFPRERSELSFWLSRVKFFNSIAIEIEKFQVLAPMEESDKTIGVGGETSSRVSAGSPSWLCASRQRFTIELRSGETTIVSWKRLVKDAQNTSPPLTARKTEDSLVRISGPSLFN